MVDEYHHEWVIQDMETEYRIISSKISSFNFLSDMAHIFDSAIENLEGIKQIVAMLTQLDLMKRKCFYIETANSI